jgi:hypothetical protein
MPVWERESGELPSPICPRSTERSGGDLLFSEILLVLLLILVIEKSRAAKHPTTGSRGLTNGRPMAQLEHDCAFSLPG